MAHGPMRRGGSFHSSSSRSFSSGHSSRQTHIHRTHSAPIIINTSIRNRSRSTISTTSSQSSPYTAPIIFLIIAMILIFIFIPSTSDNITKIRYMIDDSKEYYEIIEKADKDSEFKTTYGTIIYINEGLTYKGEDYYMIEYSYTNTLNPNLSKGLTYYSYNYNDLVKNNYVVGQKIKIAYSKFESIDYSYNLYCADYYAYRQSIITGIIVVLVSIFIVIICIKKFYSISKKIKMQEQATINSKSDTNISEDILKKSKDTYCSYCGTKITNESRCPSCGANIIK